MTDTVRVIRFPSSLRGDRTDKEQREKTRGYWPLEPEFVVIYDIPAF